MNRVLPLFKKQISLLYMGSKRTYCVGGRRKSFIIDMIEYEKRSRRTNKNVKVKKGKYVFFDVLKQ